MSGWQIQSILALFMTDWWQMKTFNHDLSKYVHRDFFFPEFSPHILFSICVETNYAIFRFMNQLMLSLKTVSEKKLNTYFNNHFKLQVSTLQSRTNFFHDVAQMRKWWNSLELVVCNPRICFLCLIKLLLQEIFLRCTIDVDRFEMIMQ